MAQRIDVHHHLVAPKFVPSMREMGVLTPHLASIMNENDAIADMDKAGVTLAVNSPTIPGQISGEALHRLLPREQRLHGAARGRLSRPVRHVRRLAAP